VNERIRELIKKSGGRFSYRNLMSDPPQKVECVELYDDAVTKFAELIVQECKENFAKVWYEQGLDVRGAEWDKFIKRFNEHFGVKV